MRGYVFSYSKLWQKPSHADDNDCQVEKCLERTGFVVKPKAQPLKAFHPGVGSLNHKPLLALQFVVEVVEKRFVIISRRTLPFWDIGKHAEI